MLPGRWHAWVADLPDHRVLRAREVDGKSQPSVDTFNKVCRALGKKLPFYQLDKVAEQGLEHGIINEIEANLLRRTEIGRKKAIDVDDFDPADLVATSHRK